MTGFVYKWTNTINGKWYIGSHKGTPDDGYRHSSKIMTFAEEKYGIDNFSREILYEGNDEKKIEGYYLKTYDAANSSMSYNLKNNAYGGNGSANKGKRKGKSWIKIHGKDLAEKLRVQKSERMRGNKISRGPGWKHTQETICIIF